MRKVILSILLVLLCATAVRSFTAPSSGSGGGSNLVAGVDYVTPTGNTSGTAGGLSSTLSISSGGTGTTFPAAAAGNLVIFTSASAMGLASAGTTTNCVWAINGSGTLACYPRLAFDAPIIVGTASYPTGTGYTYYNQTTQQTTIGNGTTANTFAYTRNYGLAAIDFPNLVSTGSTTISVYVPWAGTITSANIVCQATSTISAALYTAPTNTNTFTLISASQPVVISNGTYTASNTTLTGWTTAITAGTFVRTVFNGFTGGPCSIGIGVTKTN